MKTIGILGGGQLAQMITLAATRLGFHTIVIDTHANSPAAQAGAEEIIATSGGDQAALDELVARSDFITVEFEELFDIHMLKNAVQAGMPIHPSPATIELIKDKLDQKNFLKAHGINVGLFTKITDFDQALLVLKAFEGKMVIKTRQGGYDGNGNAVVDSKQSLKAAFDKFEGRALYAEKFVPFQKELAVMIARSTHDKTVAYPVVETRHTRNICMEVVAPAPISDSAHAKASEQALNVAKHLKGAGVFGIEMFLTAEGEVLVNEISTRVHNSGHYTIEACITSQFEQHVRAVTGMNLGKTDLLVPATAMINILGERNGPVTLKGLEEARVIPNTSVHIYGKSPTKIDRKMGHITATGKNVDEALWRAQKARKLISI